MQSVRIAFLLVALVLLAPHDVPAATVGLREARALAPLLAKRKLRAEGPGLLVAQIRLDDRSKFRKEPLDGYEVEFTRALGGGTVRAAAKAGEPLLATLPAGRYCVSAIIRSGKRFEAKCEPPYVDVTAGSVDATGILDIRIKRNAEVEARDIVQFHRDLGLTARQRATIADYLATQAERGMRTFFLSSPPGLVAIARLYPDGVAEVQRYSLANASYDEGTWRADGAGFEMASHEGNTIERFTREGAAWFGFSAHRTQIAPMRVATRADRHFAVSTDIACWHWSACGERYRSRLLATPDWSFVDDVDKLDGMVELDFALAVQDETARPRDVEVVSTSLPAKATRDVVEQFGDAQFHPGLAGEGRHRATLRFKVIGGELHVESSPPSGNSTRAAVRFEPTGPAAPARSATQRPPEPTGPDGSRKASIAQAAPLRFPPSAIRRRQAGEVLLRVEVRKDGTPGAITVVESSGTPELDEAAIESLRQSRFHPALENGEPIDATIDETRTFSFGGK